MWVILTGPEPHFTPCCLNHKTSLSLAAPERGFEQKSCLTQVLRAPQGGDCSIPFLHSHLGTILGAPSPSRECFLPCFSCWFCCARAQFVSKRSSHGGIQAQCVWNVGQNGNSEAREGLESLEGNIREEKWFPWQQIHQKSLHSYWF